ncbi:hypothetical protein DDK22_34535, partial [Cupriavidus necator]
WVKASASGRGGANRQRAGFVSKLALTCSQVGRHCAADASWQKNRQGLLHEVQAQTGEFR